MRQRIVRILLFLVLVLLAGCNPAPPASSPTLSPAPATALPPTLIPTLTQPAPASPQPPALPFDHILVPAEQASLFVSGFGIHPENTFTPTAADAAFLEAALLGYTANISIGLQPLENYARQYSGVVLGGQPKLFANYFCSDLGIDWRSQPVLVLDGGSCFFHLVFDLNTGVIESVEINGSA